MTQTVYIGKTERKAVHTDPGCQHLDHIDDPPAYDRDTFSHLPICKDCSGDREQWSGNPWTTVQQLENADPEELGLSPLR